MMYVYSADSTDIRDCLEAGAALVASLCAERCHHCDDWWGEFRTLSELFPEVCFVWLDVDEHPDMVADIPGVNAFPFLLIYTGERPQEPAALSFMAHVKPDRDVAAALVRLHLSQPSSQSSTPAPGLRCFFMD